MGHLIWLVFRLSFSSDIFSQVDTFSMGLKGNLTSATFSINGLLLMFSSPYLTLIYRNTQLKKYPVENFRHFTMNFVNSSWLQLEGILELFAILRQATGVLLVHHLLIHSSRPRPFLHRKSYVLQHLIGELLGSRCDEAYCGSSIPWLQPPLSDIFF